MFLLEGLDHNINSVSGFIFGGCWIFMYQIMLTFIKQCFAGEDFNKFFPKLYEAIFPISTK